MRLGGSNDIASELYIDGEAVSYLDLVAMQGLESLVSCLGSPFGHKRAWMSFVGVGQGELGISSEDLVLENEKYRKLGTVTTLRNAYIVQAIFGIAEPSESYILREVGLFNAIAGGLMGVRWVLDDDYIIAADDEVDITCTIYMA